MTMPPNSQTDPLSHLCPRCRKSVRFYLFIFCDAHLDSKDIHAFSVFFTPQDKGLYMSLVFVSISSKNIVVTCKFENQNCIQKHICQKTLHHIPLLL